MASPQAPELSPTRVRYGVLGFACSMSLLTYLDRICIMRVSGEIQTDLHLTDHQMGIVFAAFGLGYALFEVPSGWMGDAWGARRVITRIVLMWSFFTLLSGCVWAFSVDSGYQVLGVSLVFDSFVALVLIRFLFGCGEAGAYPNLTRVVGGWFPFRERAFTQGSIWMCARLGGAIAPLVIGRLTVALGGWRPAFWVLGLVGVVWALGFYAWFRNTPEEMSSCNQDERDLIRAGPHSWKADEAAPGHASPPWGKLLGSLNLWAVSLAAFGVSFGWYFYPTWQPKFLKETFGISPQGQNMEIRTGLPFLFGAAGSLLGGRLSDWLIQATGSRRWGRSLVGFTGFSTAGVCVLFTGQVAEAWQATALLCLAFFLNDLAIPTLWAVCADIGGRFAGTVSGFMNMVGALGAVLCPALIPVFRDNFSWPTIFVILACSWFVAALAWLAIDASKPIVTDE